MAAHIVANQIFSDCVAVVAVLSHRCLSEERGAPRLELVKYLDMSYVQY